MSKVLLIDDKKRLEVEVPEVIIHLSKMMDLALKGKKIPFSNLEWDDAYAYLALYFEELYCTLNDRDDVDEISAEFLNISKEDKKRGIIISIRIVDFTKA